MPVIYFIIGICSLVMCVVGIFLPVLPTTPLVLLSVFCFSKSSPRFHKWIVSTKLYDKYAKEFVENRSLPLSRKIFLLTLASAMLLIPLLTLSPGWRIVIIAIYIYLYYYFIFQIKTSQ